MEPFNLATAVVAQAERRPDLTVGTADDPIRLADLVALAAGRAHSLLDDGVRAGDPVALVDSDIDGLHRDLVRLHARRRPGRPGQPDLPAGPRRPDADPGRAIPRAARGRRRTIPPLRHGRRHRSARPGRRPVRRRLPHAHLRHDRAAQVLRADPRATSDAWPRPWPALSTSPPHDRVLAPLPLFHINPMGYGIITALLTGADALTVRKFSASGFWPTVVDEPGHGARPARPTGRDPQAGDHRRRTPRATSVRTMFYADREFLSRFGIPAAVSGYGSTEAGGVSHLHRWTADRRHPAGRQPAWRRHPG